MEIELKRKIFLEKLDKKFQKLECFNKFAGLGFLRKVLRLLFCPEIYLPYLFLRTSNKEIKEVNLFWNKKIKIKSQEIPFFAVAGILPGGAEYKLTKFFIKNLKETDIFYDIGANYGFYTYLALEFCKEVHSFEPLPFVFENLKLNLKDNQKVYLNEIALSDRNGVTKIYLPNTGHLDSTGSSTIIEESLDKHYYKFSESLEIKTITLDEYLKSHNPPTVIKLDVEGAESLVIEGGLNFFKNYSPIITLEAWSPEEGGEISMRAVQKLRDLGYKSYFINQDGELEFVEGDLSLIVKKQNLYDDNFVFKK
ncbi:MAG: FkbM family methyltransferase [Minisyncoccia bacterium]